MKGPQVLVLVALVALFASTSALMPSSNDCPSGQIEAVMSFPVDGQQPPYNLQSTFAAWYDAIESAVSTIDIACYYMTLTDGTAYPPQLGGYMGMSVYKQLVNAARERGVKIRIVQQTPTPRMPAYDTGNLTALGAATVRSIDFAKVNGFSNLPGSRGILHTKFIIVDKKHAYVGSANMDWRSLSQVKELGVMVSDCETYAQDLGKVFEQYWIGADSTSLPQWNVNQVGTRYTLADPMHVGPASTPLYIASGPATFAAGGRVDELDALVASMNRSTTFLKFAVMDYTPTSMYVRPDFYWPTIDNEIRAAALRGVKVQLIFSIWNSTNPKELPYWRSLNELTNVEVKVYTIPNSRISPQAPYTRVSHSKYVVSDSIAYVTTSNCGADYYLYTGGVSVSILDNTSSAFKDINGMFDADWNFDWAGPIPSQLPPK